MSGSSRLLSAVFVCTAACLLSTPLAAQWDDNFDDYDAGTTIAGQGGWAGWNQAAGIDADVTDEEAFSEPNSLRLRTDSDMVVVYSGVAEGVWTYRGMVFIPSGHTGETWFILLNTYSHGGTQNWSTQVVFTGGRVESRGGTDFGGGGSIPSVPDEWVELKVQIDLDANVQTITYGGQFVDETVWQASGLPEVQAVDLYSASGSAAYFDDLELFEEDIGATRGVIVGEQCPGPDPVEVTISNPLGGGDGNQMVTVVETVAGNIGAAGVTAAIGGAVAEVATGVEITWSVTRQQLADGLTYTVALEIGALRFDGTAGGALIVGDRSAEVCMRTNAGTGQILESQWAGIGPFTHSFGCDGPSEELLGNHIAYARIDCEYPSIDDEIDYDPNEAVSTGYTGPPGADGNPVWRVIDDGSEDGFIDLNVALGNEDDVMGWLVTYVENVSGGDLDLNICFGSDDSGQIWIDDRVVHNLAVCRGSGGCQDSIAYTMAPGIHAIKMAAWDRGGGWNCNLALQRADRTPIVSGDPDIVFLGPDRPEGFEPPECEDEVCGPVSELFCERSDDGTVDLDWENSAACEGMIEIRVNGELVESLDPSATSYTVDPASVPYARTVSVTNGSGLAASCSVVDVLGTGTAALLGSDLTDIDDDGDETLYNPPDDLGDFDATFFSSDEPGFGGGEFAYNVFDNAVGGGNDKWCCGTSFPQIVGADLGDARYVLTHFTVGSGNDTPTRDPRVWRIEGSNDGESWTAIFSQNDPGTALWTERNQVILFTEGIDYPEQSEGYSMFRMVTEATGLTSGAFFQITEIEFFGEEATGPVGASLRPADVNGDGTFNISDPVAHLNFLFSGGVLPGCFVVPGSQPVELTAPGVAILDFNGDGDANLTDAVGGLNRLFSSGPPHALGEGCVTLAGDCADSCVP